MPQHTFHIGVQKMEADSYRFKTFLIGRRELMVWAQMGHNLSQGVCLPRIPEIPPDARIHHIIDTPGHMAIGLVIEHPSFDEVEDGQEIPTLNANVVTHCFQVLNDKYIPDWQYVSDEDLKAIRDSINEVLYDREHQPKTI